MNVEQETAITCPSCGSRAQAILARAESHPFQSAILRRNPTYSVLVFCLKCMDTHATEVQRVDV